MKKCYVYAGVTVLIWSTLAVTVKLLLADIPNFQALCISSVFAFVFLLALNIVNGSIQSLRRCRARDLLLMAGLGFLGLFMYSALYYYGIGALGSQEACILNYLWPVMIVVFACVILKEPFTLRKLCAILMSFSGIVVLTAAKPVGASQSRLLGVIACIAAAVCYGLFSVLNKLHSLDQNVTMMCIWFTVALCSFVAGMLFEQWVPVRGAQWAGLAWLGTAVDAVAYLLWALALKDAKDSARIANFAYLVPFLSMILSAVAAGERMTLGAVFALLLIVGGILLQSLPSRKAKGEKRRNKKQF